MFISLPDSFFLLRGRRRQAKKMNRRKQWVQERSCRRLYSSETARLIDEEGQSERRLKRPFDIYLYCWRKKVQDFVSKLNTNPWMGPTQRDAIWNSPLD